ncbi:MAG TPA: hypothetical protein VI958_00355 [Acidobacteriota bacterium]
MKRIVSLLGLFFLCAGTASAWHVNTHLQLTRDAIALMPAELQKTFTEHQKFVEAGIKDPDEMIKDWSNHYYIPATKEGNGIGRIQKIVSIVQNKLKNSTTMDSSKQLCYLAHYIADLWSPESIMRGNTIPDIDFTKNNDILVFYEGYQKPIENIEEYLNKRSEWRWRLENSKEISPLLYSEAVNDIARIWLTLWQQAGNAVEPQNPSVIFHKKGALNINYERLLLEERIYWYSAWHESQFIDAYDSHYKEVERLEALANPSEAQLVAGAEARNQEEMMNRLNPAAPFKMLESSMKTIADKAYFVARVRNQGETEIPSIAFMYPGIRGPIALIKSLKPGQAAKVEATLPPNAAKDQIQLIFASTAQ